MEILRHSQISTTMNTYAHVLPRLQRDATTKIEELIDEPTPKGEGEETSTPEISVRAPEEAGSEDDSDAGNDRL
jgi:hypothetical protein